MSPMDPNRGSRERYSLRRLKQKRNKNSAKSRERRGARFSNNNWRFLVAVVVTEILLLILFAAFVQHRGSTFIGLHSATDCIPEDYRDNLHVFNNVSNTEGGKLEKGSSNISTGIETSEINATIESEDRFTDEIGLNFSSSSLESKNTSNKCSNARPRDLKNKSSSDISKNSVVYKMFMDVHVMIFIGFGFLMTFLRRYGYSSVGLNMLVSALSIQWAALATGFFRMDNGKIPIGIENILGADLATAAVLISLGAVLGKTSPLQLLVMAIGEIAVFATNEWLGTHVFQAVDAGGSMFVHVFGAYFGLAVSYILCRGGSEKHHSANEGASYRSDLFAMIGTIFLWIFWPSFNAALVTGDQQHRAIINTYFALAACCVTAFAISATVTKGFKFDMVHIQNATLAGGVAVGTAADMMVQPFGALIIGMAAGALSVFGYHFLQPFLLSKMNLHDTCGVHNLHGMPGVMAGIVGAIMAGIASEADYNYSLYTFFAARTPVLNSTDFQHIAQEMIDIAPGLGRSAQGQAGYQLLALGCTWAIAIVSGLIMGMILKLPVLSQVPQELLYDDKFNWEVPEVGDEEGMCGTARESVGGTIYIPDGKRAGQGGIDLDDS